MPQVGSAVPILQMEKPELCAVSQLVRRARLSTQVCLLFSPPSLPLPC